MIPAERRPELLCIADAILQCQDDGLRAHQGRHGGNRLDVVVHLDRVQDQIDRPHGPLSVGSVGPDRKLPGQVAGDPKPLAPDGLKMSATSDERDLLPSASKQAAKVSADAPGAHDGYTHE